jgi:glutamate formiminotransferase
MSENRKKLAVTVPNFSVGKDTGILAEITGAFGRAPGVELRGAEMDSDHNRAVVTAVGEPEALAEAVFRGAEAAVRLIDMTRHRGVHPRIGAVDVIPFIPCRGVSIDELVALAGRLGQRLADNLSLPVYFYGRAARRPDRQHLSSIRNSGFESLGIKLGRNPSLAPDIGPNRLHPTAGAVAVGVRDFLIAYNVVIDSPDLALARRIAADIRETGGGLPGVKALGLMLESRGKAQVSMTLNSLERAGLREAYQAVERLAGEEGVEVLDSEIVGLAPLEAVLDVLRSDLKLKGFSPEKILEVCPD